MLRASSENMFPWSNACSVRPPAYSEFAPMNLASPSDVLLAYPFCDDTSLYLGSDSVLCHWIMGKKLSMHTSLRKTGTASGDQGREYCLHRKQ